MSRTHFFFINMSGIEFSECLVINPVSMFSTGARLAFVYLLVFL